LFIYFGIDCATIGTYRGGINMCGLSVSHPNDSIGGLNGVPSNGFPLGEPILGTK
jgi:hypothetical protein